jgi:hypothetical protein
MVQDLSQEKLKILLAKVGNDRTYTITIFRYAINSMVKNILRINFFTINPV